MFTPDTLPPGADLVGRGLIVVPHEVYRAAPGVSRSGLEHFARSPAHYRAFLEQDERSTPALRFGRIFHRYLLEPDLCRLAVYDGPAKNTKAGKDAWAEFLERVSGAEIVSAEEHAALEGMMKSVRAHRSARDLMDIPGPVEASRWNYPDKRSGVLAKARPDKLLDSLSYVLDLKTAEDASPAGFAKAVAKHRYHVQQAWYVDTLGLPPDTPFFFVAVEKAAPYAVAVYQLAPEDAARGREVYRRELLDLAECMSRDEWPAYSQNIETLTLPAWARQGA